MKKQKFMGCIDNSGNKLAFYVTNTIKYHGDPLSFHIYFADLEIEQTSSQDLVYEQFTIPE